MNLSEYGHFEWWEWPQVIWPQEEIFAVQDKERIFIVHFKGKRSAVMATSSLNAQLIVAKAYGIPDPAIFLPRWTNN